VANGVGKRPGLTISNAGNANALGGVGHRTETDFRSLHQPARGAGIAMAAREPGLFHANSSGGSLLLGDLNGRVGHRSLGQFALRLMIEFLIPPIGLSGLLPKLIGTTYDFNPARLGHRQPPAAFSLNQMSAKTFQGREHDTTQPPLNRRRRADEIFEFFPGKPTAWQEQDATRPVLEWQFQTGGQNGQR
jgi:hypothetical protein